jgi:hypothetical protein
MGSNVITQGAEYVVTNLPQLHIVPGLHFSLVLGPNLAGHDHTVSNRTYESPSQLQANSDLVETSSRLAQPEKPTGKTLCDGQKLSLNSPPLISNIDDGVRLLDVESSDSGWNAPAEVVIEL